MTEEAFALQSDRRDKANSRLSLQLSLLKFMPPSIMNIVHSLIGYDRLFMIRSTTVSSASACASHKAVPQNVMFK
jgi:hypothetical protein